jgi:hypothetical protein
MTDEEWVTLTGVVVPAGSVPGLRVVTPEEAWAAYDEAHAPKVWGEDCDDISVWAYTDTDSDEDRWSWSCGCGAPHPPPSGFRGYGTALEAIDALRAHATSGSAT